MARNQSSNPRDRWRQTKLAAERGLRRVERRNRPYVADKWQQKHSPVKNPRFKIKGKGRGTLRIDLPASLDLYSAVARDGFLKAVAELKKSALFERRKKIVLDFSKVVSISPDAALVLLAEIQRCRAYCTGRTQLTGTYPSDHKVTKLLIEIGFYESLGVKEPSLPTSFSSRAYIKIERQNRVLGVVVDGLLDKFCEQVDLDIDDRKRLHVALLECMDNVYQHAYAADSSTPHLYKEWWMAGYTDHLENKISFVFFDQGAGIASTIKKRKHARILRLLSGWDDSNWIDRAIRKPESRFASKRRGHGLEKLKRFLERTEMSGELIVVANQGEVKLTAGRPSVLSQTAVPLDGTLVVWSLVGVSATHDRNGEASGN